MPGRQGSGPLGGGGGHGGGFGGGGGFRGGGGFGGGGYRGGGWGGGWGGGYRGGWGGGYRGGWGWRPRLWGGWGWGLPWLFGPRYGYGGGWGCGGLGCGLLLLIVFLFVVAGGAIGGIGSFFGGSGGYSNGGYANASGSGNTSGSGGGLSSQPPSVQTQTALDLAELHTALDNRIPTWQNQLSNNQEQHIPASDAGMGNDNNIKDIVYGKCGSGFFVFVVDKGAPTNAGGANGQGYAYTTASSPSICHPSQYQVTDWENDGGGWWFVYLQS